MATNLENLLAASDGTQSYALLDGASIPNLYSRLEALDVPFTSLLNGWSSAAFLRVAPFIAEIDPGSPRLEKLIDDAIPVGGMVWFCSTQPIDRIRSRLFKFYYWRKGKKHVYARIADAMYFSSLLRIANSDQLRMLGAIAHRVVIPRNNQFDVFVFDNETGHFVPPQQATEEVS
ncbi:DUF4123 domain-containing protein [Agrobacterium tumefaciens]|uniref:DUF4123 domain-containing protein n=1 Tax=Agrobacterium tumefaciens TaxID=358 RepID=UPI0009B68455|nr:DUF4123 domain-containing protein [Agrobacterium tumefaciens]